jgi:hypothetical protein
MAKTPSTIEIAEEKIEAFADDLGRVLHSAKTKAEGWLGQRQRISKHLAEIRDTASDLLTQLGHRAASAVTPIKRRRRPGRPKRSKTLAVINKIRATVVAQAPRKKRTMSAKARAAISAAQKARWAKVKAAAKKT